MEETKAFMEWMYILKCADGSYCVGSTRNLDLRMAQHQSGQGSRYTSGRLPVELVYGEEYDRIVDAYAREKQVQNWSRAKREALISGELPSRSQTIRRLPQYRDQQPARLDGIRGLDTPSAVRWALDHPLIPNVSGD